MQFATAPLASLLAPGGHSCTCGRHHGTGLSFLRIGPGAINALPQALKELGAARPFIVCDPNTRAAAWPLVEPVLREAGIAYVLRVLPGAHLEPDERTVGALTMAFDPACDLILALGAGVINDCCKVLGHAIGRDCAVVATAPSMDGYASNSASMIQDRVKVSLYNSCPRAIIADTRILCQAPMPMLWAGLGDMLAKCISLCEWRIAHLVTGEYFCDNVAGLMRASLQQVVAAGPGLKERDPEAIAAVTQGLVLSGIAMSYAQVSRPASGLEHYFSHLWEMMALERGQASQLHGIQVGVGTYLTLKLYDQLRELQPDRAKAQAFAAGFSQAAWETQMRDIFGSVAGDIIEQELTHYHKNDPQGHRQRLDRILSNWQAIQQIIREELPPVDQVESLMASLGMPIRPCDLGIGQEDVYRAFLGSREIRDKYLTSSLLWDLGLLHEVELAL